MRRHVVLATEKDKIHWNAFVKKQRGSIYLLWEWGGIIRKSLGLKPYFFMVKNERNQVEGIWPLFLSSKNKEKSLVSLPCTGYVDPLAKNVEILRELLDFIVKWSQKKNILFEAVWTLDLTHIPNGASQKTDGVCDFITQTNLSFADWQQTHLEPDQKRILRQAKTIGVTIQRAGKSDLQEFYSLHLKTLKKRGVAAFPFSLYEHAFHQLNPYSWFFKATIGNKTKAYLWGFFLKDAVFFWKNAYVRGSSKESIYYNALIAYFLEQACSKRQVTTVDFGTAWCKGGLARFKRRWGFLSRPVFVISNQYLPPYSQTISQLVREKFIQHCPLFIYTWLAKKTQYNAG